MDDLNLLNTNQSAICSSAEVKGLPHMSTAASRQTITMQIIKKTQLN